MVILEGSQKQKVGCIACFLVEPVTEPSHLCLFKNSLPPKQLASDFYVGVLALKIV